MIDEDIRDEAGSTAEDFLIDNTIKPQTVIICPVCGGVLDEWQETDGQGDYITEYYCKTCKKRIK